MRMMRNIFPNSDVAGVLLVAVVEGVAEALPEAHVSRNMLLAYSQRHPSAKG